jgi:hypothetical protein
MKSFKRILIAVVIGLIVLYTFVYITTPEHKIVYHGGGYHMGLGFNK